MFCPRPDLVDASDVRLPDRVGKRSRANALNIVSVVDQLAGGFNGALGAWMPANVVNRVYSILHMPCHDALMISEDPWGGKRVLLPTGVGYILGRRPKRQYNRDSCLEDAKWPLQRRTSGHGTCATGTATWGGVVCSVGIASEPWRADTAIRFTAMPMARAP
jgi:hypothetical protein